MALERKAIQPPDEKSTPTVGEKVAKRVREQALDRVNRLINTYGLENIPGIHRLRFHLSMQQLIAQGGVSPEKDATLSSLNPDFLSPEENFETAMYLYGMESKSSEKKYYDHLRAAALQGNQNAKRFLLAIASSSTRYPEYVSRTDSEFLTLFKAVNEDDFIKQFQQVAAKPFLEAKEESKAGETIDRHVRATVEKITKIIHPLLHHKSFMHFFAGAQTVSGQTPPEVVDFLNHIQRTENLEPELFSMQYLFELKQKVEKVLDNITTEENSGLNTQFKSIHEMITIAIDERLSLVSGQRIKIL